jgi:hypothetical protein
MVQTRRILLCTVGGSHQPIVTAIREIQPDFICFVCTGKDPSTDRPGSELQVSGKGKVIKAHRDDEKPTLPNIPTQMALREEQYEVRLVPADDMDGAAEGIAEAIYDLAARFPEATLLAEYAGGTKTMSAALVVVALEMDQVELRLVTGARANLERVHDGTQVSTVAPVEGLRLRRAMSPYLGAWRRFAYGEAARGLAGLNPPRDPNLRADLQTARDLSRAFDAWDRFDHQRAADIFHAYKVRIGVKGGGYLAFLELLNLPEDDGRKAPACLYDLWCNAQRRAAQWRYDDAVARTYRLLEWTAQWLLRSRAGVDTSDLRKEQLVEGVTIAGSHSGKLQAGLFSAWEMVGHYIDGPPKDFVQGEMQHLRHHVQKRNESILAHGYTAVSEEMWNDLASWVEETFLTVLRTEAAASRVHHPPSQLPTEPLWETGPASNFV